MSKVTQLTHKNGGAGTEKGHGPWSELHALFAELPPLRAMGEPVWYLVAEECRTMGGQFPYQVSELHFDGVGQGDRPSRETDNFKAFALAAARLLGLSDWRDWLDHLAQSPVVEVERGPGRTKISDAARASADLCQQYAVNGAPVPAAPELITLSRSEVRARIDALGSMAEFLRKTGIAKTTMRQYLSGQHRTMNNDGLERLARGIDVPVSRLPKG